MNKVIFVMLLLHLSLNFNEYIDEYFIKFL